jgi:hypothetical protein
LTTLRKSLAWDKAFFTDDGNHDQHLIWYKNAKENCRSFANCWFKLVHQVWLSRFSW